MVNEQTILTAERLRGDLVDLKKSLRTIYPNSNRQVTSDDIRKLATKWAEVWLAEISTDQDVNAVIGAPVASDMNVQFQRLLTIAEHATKRSKYDAILKSIISSYTVSVILPLKQSRGRAKLALMPEARVEVTSAFIGESFDARDKSVNECVAATLSAIGIRVFTGEQPKADLISEKVKRLIEQQSVFVGVFTRRDKISRKQEWTTSPWVIDEKAYAVGQRKPLILIKEQGVGSIGGIQGDYQYVEFSRDSLETLAISLLGFFQLINGGLTHL